MTEKAGESRKNRAGRLTSLWRTYILDATQRLSLLFALIALHSFLVGVALILHPPVIMRFFGFHPIGEGFFPVQGGVFHIILSLFYLVVAFQLEGFRPSIVFSIIVKTTGFLFLMIYYFLVDPIIIVLFSGIGDGAMALAMLWAYLTFKKQA